MGSMGMTPTLRDHYETRPLVVTDRVRGDSILRSASLSGRHLNTLQPLNEDDAAPSFAPAHRTFERPRQAFDQEESTGSTMDTAFPMKTTLTRSRSSMQMRDLREQMQDLKGKISTLKERARKDTLRRRSLQSLRMPSPFTAAEQWHTSTEVHRNDLVDTLSGHQLNEAHEIVEQAEAIQGTKPEDTNGSVPLNDQEESSNGVMHGAEDDHSVAPSQYESAVENADEQHDTLWNDENALLEEEPYVVDEGMNDAEDEVEEDSILGEQDFYESSPSPVGERHEDRADAFDYEHFFLRSDMGNYSRTKPGRRSSFDSTDSAETTKAPSPLNHPSHEQGPQSQQYQESSQLWPKGHHRNNSVDSVSTFATFATATEGRGSDAGSEDDEDEWEQHQRNHPMAGTWNQDYFSHQSSATPGIWSSGAHGQVRPDVAVRLNGHLTPGSPTSSDSPSTTRSFPLVNKSKHLTPSPSPQPLSTLVSNHVVSTRPEESTEQATLDLSREDGDLVERLLESVGKICNHLRAEGESGSNYDSRVWRRRLDAARRVLDGEIAEDGLR